MDDREIVAALAAGDLAGIAAAYDTYAGPVYGYCRWMLREPAEAAEAARDTFVIAADGVPANPGLLRSWFFATARGECLRRPSLVRGEPVEAAVLEDASGAAGTGMDKREAERAELRALIPATLAQLGPEQREAVVLSLWHDLDDADLAAVFGVSRPEAYTMASGGRGQLEKALGTPRLARTGRAACPELATVLADWDGRLTMDTLHRASRHVEQCQTCAAAMRGQEAAPGGPGPAAAAGRAPRRAAGAGARAVRQPRPGGGRVPRAGAGASREAAAGTVEQGPAPSPGGGGRGGRRGRGGGRRPGDGDGQRARHPAAGPPGQRRGIQRRQRSGARGRRGLGRHRDEPVAVAEQPAHRGGQADALGLVAPGALALPVGAALQIALAHALAVILAV
jgi:DNA-directed RNA polymerase specialized sigma24 family protein